MKHSHLTRWTPAAIVVIAGTTNALAVGLFGASFELSLLNGTDGFVINGIDMNDYSGDSVSTAGDINGDGVDDLIIGALFAADYGRTFVGESYVVFGSTNLFPPVVELSSLNGANGFVIRGIDAGDLSGISVSDAGDFNGDGVDDLVIGARHADPNWQSNSGESYVVFGSSSPFPPVLRLSTLNGTNGIVINGVDANDRSGQRVSAAGDINGDGVDDLIIGAEWADPNGQIEAGESYIVFGSVAPFPQSLNLSSLTGANGFVINGVDAYDYCGASVSAAGDINGDGVDDLVIGARRADPNGATTAGETYVVFGSTIPFAPVLNLASLNGSNGFVINGIDAGDGSGSSVSAAGDINSDGVDDLIIGASGGDSNGQNAAGESYVVFGSLAPFPPLLELSSLNGADGFVINGVDAYDSSGASVSDAGDINGDGLNDLIIGAPTANSNGQSNAGESYIVFGSVDPFQSALELSSIDGLNGFVINGVDAGDGSGLRISAAGDINDDGVDDIIIGARWAAPNGVSGAGATYVVFGRTPCPADLNADGVVDTADLGVLLGQFNTPGPGADINGDGTVDTADLGILLGAFGTTTCP